MIVHQPTELHFSFGWRTPNLHHGAFKFLQSFCTLIHWAQIHFIIEPTSTPMIVCRRLPVIVVVLVVVFLPTYPPSLGVHDYRWDLSRLSPKTYPFLCCGHSLSVVGLAARPVCLCSVFLPSPFLQSTLYPTYRKVRRPRGGREERGRRLWVCSYFGRSPSVLVCKKCWKWDISLVDVSWGRHTELALLVVAASMKSESCCIFSE